jgi:eukaryotic-like serine/threonine-protein kinase
MPLSPGTRLGPFEIVAPLGAGGMGEVYRARDARLGRDVALKVLPPSVAANAERLKRFEKEARSASALNHPNLVTIHDIGSSNGVEFIAMELVEGRTLREVLADGALPSRTLFGIAAQTADGLAKAHGAGIVHRDLKPENLMVSRDGFVKILDFGLAKLTQPEQPNGQTEAPTVSGATEPGVVMGTAGYMSPEQALGRPVDFRSDQFSLGSILYEMATGRRAFSRDSAPETLTAIIRDEPEPIGRLAPLSPAPLSWIVERCLSKNPDDRYASTRDLSRDLATLRDRVSETSGRSVAVESGATPARRATRAWPWIAAACLVAAVAALLWAMRRPAPPPAPVLRFSVNLPEGVSFESGEIEGQHALSPDGRKLVFAGRAQATRRLYLRSLDSMEVRSLEGTEGAVSPFWSPDSRSLGFFAEGKLQRLDFTGPPRTICAAATLETLPSWGSAGKILFAQIAQKEPGLFVVDAAGGQPRRVVYKNQDGSNGLWTTFLPDGKRFLFLSRNLERTREDPWHLIAGSIDSPETTEISDAIWSRVEYVQPGYLVYAKQGALLAQRFDADKLRLTGTPVTLAEHVYYFNGPAQAGFSASEAGVVTYEKLAAPSRVAWLDRTGREIERVALEGIVGGVRLSPDGRTIAAHIWDEKVGTSDIWLYDLSRRLSTRLTLDVEDEQTAVWSADGSRIYFRGDRFGPPDIWSISTASPGRPELFFRGPGVQHPDDVSADGKSMVFTEWSRQTNGDLWLLSLSPDAEPTPLETGPYYEAGARFSPDGRFLAYVSSETGTLEIYVRTLEGRGERVRVSAEGGRLPRWRRDGKELFYVAANGDLVAVPVGTGARPEPGSPSVLFRLDGQVRDYAVDASGQRFLVDTAPTETAPIDVLVNWPALVPGDARR